MPAFRFLSRPTPAQVSGIIALYRAEGWWDVDDDDPEIVRRMVAGSQCFLVAEEDGGVVGMGRAVGDGMSDAYIQDVAVAAPHRGRGLGARIMDELVRRLKADGVTWIGLIAAPGTAAFYEKLGFEAMRNAVPMTLPSRAGAS